MKDHIHDCLAAEPAGSHDPRDASRDNASLRDDQLIPLTDRKHEGRGKGIAFVIQFRAEMIIQLQGKPRALGNDDLSSKLLARDCRGKGQDQNQWSDRSLSNPAHLILHVPLSSAGQTTPGISFIDDLTGTRVQFLDLRLLTLCD